MGMPNCVRYSAVGHFEVFTDQTEALGVAIRRGLTRERSRIGFNPLGHEVVAYHLISRYPYGICCTIESDETIMIWAVKHPRRDPDYWQEIRSADK